jgi:mannitol-1-/sugar-/sorbitol-6-/2-deoxyglucose-6-phosphatase
MALRAVIFDMDGVLIDSEHLWRMAMISGFGEAGMVLSEDDCRETMGKRFREVVAIWLERKKSDADPTVLEDRVHQLLIELIEKRGRPIPGITEIIRLCESAQLKMGLATSSSILLMNKVLDTLDLRDKIKVAVSAEHMQYAKPHPQVFLDCAALLNVRPEHCLVIEDSLNGVIAAKAAGMKVIAVPDEGFRAMQQFAIADYKASDMFGALEILENLTTRVT